MIIFPAIDLKDGKCVRLVHGEMAQETVFNEDPAAQARAFQGQDAEWLHVVDLNGAFEGRPVNAEAVQGILEAVTIPVQLGGGIRDIDTARRWIELGVSRLILGTAAVSNPDFVQAACEEFPGKIAVGIDVKDGYVAVEGWAKKSDITALELAEKLSDAGVSMIVYTDISRDGAMQGPNLHGTLEFARAVPVPVILSGGVASLDDIRAVCQAVGMEQRHVDKLNGIAGIITGRALYDGRVDLKEAVRIARELTE